jgi:hypothetical protein
MTIRDSTKPLFNPKRSYPPLSLIPDKPSRTTTVANRDSGFYMTL